MQFRIRAVSAFVAAVFVVASTAVPAGAVAGFGDVAADQFYSDAVQWMVDAQITAGTSPGCFSPGNATSRGEVATFIHRSDGEPAGGGSGFDDVSDDDFFADAVGWMVETGITTGTTASTFSPDRLVTRGEVAAFLHRTAGAPTSSAANFSDVSDDDFFAEAVGWMVETGITTGTSPTTFSPGRYVTRGEVATFLYRAEGSPAVSLTGGGSCTTAGTAVGLAVAEAMSFDLLNDLRSDLGLPALVRLASMDAAARGWSETMDLTGDFRHSNLGYGENIAWWSAGSVSPEAAAQKMHDLWVNSPGHYANMTYAGYNTIGIGFWRSDSGGWHATHVFDS